jgi:hypothetical protein
MSELPPDASSIAAAGADQAGARPRLTRRAAVEVVVLAVEYSRAYSFGPWEAGPLPHGWLSLWFQYIRYFAKSSVLRYGLSRFRAHI